jgi:1-phosphofructokinase family hexose kinase
MILTINLNAALDRIYFIDRFKPDTHMRTQKALLSIGGKGLCVARVLKSLGTSHCAISFIAGTNGEILAGLLGQLEISTELIWIPGETREANVIVETDFNRHSHITTSGYQLNHEYCEKYLNKIREIGRTADWAVIAGSMPQGTPGNLYGRIIEVLHENGVRVLIDATGGPLLEALHFSPEIVKMNQDEFLSTFKVKLSEDLTEWIPAGLERMRDFKIKALVLTCGSRGILAFTPDGDYHAGCDNVKEVNAAGAGDAVSAALVHSLLQGNSWKVSLALAAAVGAATVMTTGTAECYQNDIQALSRKVWVNDLV